MLISVNNCKCLILNKTYTSNVPSFEVVGRSSKKQIQVNRKCQLQNTIAGKE